MTRKKVLIGVAVIVILGVIAYVNVRRRNQDLVEVTVETIAKHDLEAIVSASGKIQPKRQVNVSAETMGKVVNLAVREGDTVVPGQLLLQIDPRILQSMVQNREASLATARSQLEQTRAQVESSRVGLRQSEDVLKRLNGLWEAGLISRDELERAQNDVKLRQTDLAAAEQSVRTQEQRIRQEQANLESAQYDLSKVRIVSPIAGLVTRRNIEEGETVVTGTMNNAGTVLLTIADMSIIDTEIEVDETDVPHIQIGQPANVTIDAIPNKTFPGRVTEVGNSPIQATGAPAQAATGRATNFKVVVTINGEVPNVRPGFTCTAVITTATRQSVAGVPIQAMTIREVILDSSGAIVRTPFHAAKPAAPPVSGPKEPAPGQTRKEIEGVFVLRDGRAVFQPVKMGIAGERYFEILDGLAVGDQVITGPFASVRSLEDGQPVKVGTGSSRAPGGA